MSPDSPRVRGACALAICVALSLTVASQAPADLETAHYDIFAREGAEADLAFVRRWMDTAEQVMASKYHVVPNRYRMAVHVLSRPENDINATQSGQNQCCSTDDRGQRTGTIFLLGPSAPLWKERPLVSSLGLPKVGEDYHAKVLMSEYIPIGHYAVQDGRSAGGWRYYSAPAWFVQGLQEYDGIFHTTEANRAQTANALMRWARQNQGRFTCCTNGLELVDVYNGGAAFMAFLAAEFGEGIHERLLRSGASTFDEALASETQPHPLGELLTRFRRWLAASG